MLREPHSGQKLNLLSFIEENISLCGGKVKGGGVVMAVVREVWWKSPYIMKKNVFFVVIVAAIVIRHLIVEFFMNGCSDSGN